MLQYGGNSEGQTGPSLPSAGCRWKSLPCSANTLKLGAASRVLTVCGLFFFCFQFVCAHCPRLTNGLRSRGRALARAGTCVGMQAVCVLDGARVCVRA